MRRKSAWFSQCISSCLEEIEYEALRYVTCIAIKHRTTYPQFGMNTPFAMPRTLPTWIQLMNRGGLTTHTDSFLAAVQRLDVNFDTYHGDGDDSLHTCNGVVANTVSFLSSQSDCSDLPTEVITTFARLKICFRLRKWRSVSATRRLEKKHNKKLTKFTT